MQAARRRADRLAPLSLLCWLPCSACQRVAAPPPPYGLPPWAPGMAPPVPGPVFSPAFNALLVLLVIGCVVLGINLRDSIRKMRESDIGEDNEMLTAAEPGSAQWLKGIQRTRGRAAGALPPVVAPRPKGKARGGRSAADEEAEMAILPKPKKKSKAKGGKR